MTALLRLFRYAAPYRLRFFAAIVAMLVYAAASAGLAYLIKPILDSVLPHGEKLPRVVTEIIGFYLAGGLGAYFSTYLMVDIGQRVVRDLRSQLHRHILGQSASFFARRTTGQLLSRVTNDVGQVQHAVSETIGDLLQESVKLIGYAVLLFYMDPALALVCITGAPLIVYPLAQLGRRLRRTTRRSQEAVEQLSHIATEAYTGHRIVKAFGAEQREARRFESATERLYRINMSVTSIVSILPPLMELLGGVAIAVALWYGSREIAQNRLTPGEFTSFIAALLLMYGPVKKLSRVNASLQQAIAAAERIFEVLDRHTEVVEKAGGAAAAAVRACHRILRRGVRCTTIPIGRSCATCRSRSAPVEMIAIVGRSGAGKTTLANLLPRFFDVTGGEYHDRRRGHPRRDTRVLARADRHGHPGHDPLRRFHRAKHRYGVPDATRDQIEAAARAANAHDFILGLSDQDTRRSSASAVSGCRVASGSGSPSHAPS